MTTWCLFGLCLLLAATLLWRARGLRCKHLYVEHARTYVPPACWTDIAWVNSHERQRRAAGYTTIFFRCTLCPSMHVQELPGQHFGGGTVTKLHSVR